MQRGILSGLAAFRWAGWAWMATVLVVSRGELQRPAIAIVLVGAALALTATLTVLLRRRPLLLTRPPMLVVEVALGAALLAADGFAYGKGHAFSTSQSLGVAWPLAGVLATGTILGPFPGTTAGLVMAGARLISTVVNGVALDEITGGRVLSLASSAVLYGMAGGVTGYVAGLLKRAEHEVSVAQAREEMARHLHDGVLQTLAVVERRSNDPALARLAREQERDLREYLYGLREASTALAPALRKAAARFEDVHGGRVQVVVADDLAELRPDQVEAIAGAVGEALVNAGKHGGAAQVTIYAEPGEDGQGLFCSVKDDGRGFDPDSTAEGTGLAHSVRGRLEELGGKAEVSSRPGEGAEVRLWLP